MGGAARLLPASAVARTRAAGLTRASLPSDREGRAAPACRRGLRISDHELGTLEAFPIVDLGARQILHAHGINEELDAEIFNAGIAIADLLVELEAIREPGAAAALYEHPQHELRITLALDKSPDLAGRGVGQNEARCCCFDNFHCVRLRLKIRLSDKSLEAARCAVKTHPNLTSALTALPAATHSSCATGASFPIISAPSVISITP